MYWVAKAVVADRMGLLELPQFDEWQLSETLAQMQLMSDLGKKRDQLGNGVTPWKRD